MTAPHSLKIALAQLDPVVGDLKGNAERAVAAHARAKKLGADVVVFSELFLNGYPPEDLVLRPAFQDATRAKLEWLAATCADGPAILIGTIWALEGKVYNAVALLDGGRIQATTLKVDLPNYGVFDEKRVFAAGPMPGPSEHSRRAHRRSDLRGHLGHGSRRNARRDGRRDLDLAERLAVRLAEARCPA